jgi:hypothetical protein
MPSTLGTTFENSAQQKLGTTINKLGTGLKKLGTTKT